jgi:hypothetical protein
LLKPDALETTEASGFFEWGFSTIKCPKRKPKEVSK